MVSDAGEARARRVAHEFESLRDLFGSVINARVDSSRPLIVLAVKDEEGLKQLLPGHFKGGGRVRPAGIFVGGDTYQIALRLDVGGEHPYHVVYHEYLHLLNRLNFRRLPLWANEGLAEFYATAEVDEREVRFGKMLPWHIHSLRTGSLLPLDTLLAADSSSMEYDERIRVGTLYAQSAALVHYFLMGDRGAHRKALSDYLTLLGQGVPEAEAGPRAFGDLKKLEKALAAYVHQWQFFGAKAPLRQDPQAVSVHPLGDAEALALRASFLVHTGRPAEARPLVDGALRLAPELGLAHQVLGRILAAKGRARDALAELDRAVALSPRDFIAHYRLGLLSLSKDPADASRRERSLRQALEVQPSYAPAQGALASVLQQQERAVEALVHAERAVALEPNEPWHRLRLASVLRAARRAPEAEQVEAGVLDAARSYPGGLAQLSAFYRDEDRPAEAEALLLRARATQPRHAGTLRMVAELLAQMKKHDEAEATYRQALALQPENPALLNGLGYLNADRNVRVEEALRLIDKALEKQPGDFAALDSRGWALFRLGRLAEAERDLRRALERHPNPDDPIVLEHLGDVLAKRGAREQALDCWRRALSDESLDDEQREAIQRKLARAAEAPARAPGRQQEGGP